MTALCNIDGEISAEADARVPVMDRGFLFGDSVYEVLRTRRSVPFAFPEHLERLRSSADGIALALDLDDRAILRRVKDTIAAAQVPEAYIRIIATRGTGSLPNIDLAHAPGPPRWVILVRELKAAAPAPAQLALIGRLRTDPRALDPGIKSGNYLNNLLGLAEAKARGASDCLFLNQEGHVTEASTSNFFLVERGRISTPPPSAGILRGITRALLLELGAEIGSAIDERDLTVEDLGAADEMFLSSTLRDLVPVVAVDGEPVGNGRPGPVVTRLAERFAAFCDRRTRERYAPAFAAL